MAKKTKRVLTAFSRYNLVIPTALYADVCAIAEARGTSVLEVIKQCLRLGVYLMHERNATHATLILRQDGKEREITLL